METTTMEFIGPMSFGGGPSLPRISIDTTDNGWIVTYVEKPTPHKGPPLDVQAQIAFYRSMAKASTAVRKSTDEEETWKADENAPAKSVEEHIDEAFAPVIDNLNETAAASEGPRTRTYVFQEKSKLLLFLSSIIEDTTPAS